MTSLAEHLERSASRYARRALAAYLDKSIEDFVVFAGFAIEHQLKHRLVLENPAYIGPSGPKDFASTVALQRSADDVSKLPPGTRTIGASDALARAGHVVPSLLPAQRSNIEEILRYRNGQAHLGASDATVEHRLFITFLTGMETLRTMSADEMWSTHAALVAETLSAQVEAVRKGAMLKIAAAKQHFSDRDKHLTAAERRALLVPWRVQRDQMLANSVQSARSADCPVCGSPAIAFGEAEFQEIVEGDQDDYSVHIDFTFWAERVSCGICGVDLEGPDEIEASGMDSVYDDSEHGWVAFEKQYSGYEPDFDDQGD